MRRVVVDCGGVTSTDEFWQRYLDAARPEAAQLFGRNLDALWDAVEGGGPGWPGNVEFVFRNHHELDGLLNRAGNNSFLDCLSQIADEATVIPISFE